MESSVRRGEKVLRELGMTAVTSATPGDALPNNLSEKGNSDDGEMKASGDDSGMGLERSGSGSDDLEAEAETKSAETAREENGVYEIERILDFDSECSQYKVKWKDWEEDFNTWEPIGNLGNCEEEMTRFFLERKEERELAEAQSEYVSLPNGKRRRKGPPLRDMPPDPRPLQSRAQEFYKKTQVPTEEEIDECVVMWKGFLTLKKNTWLWGLNQLNKVLQDGIDGKLNFEEQKALREQLLVQQFNSRRQTVLKQLKDWEADINSTTNGMPTVKVENQVDLAGPPPGFKYINDYIPGPGIHIPDDPPLGCACTDCFQNRKDCCANQFNSTFAYSQYKRLRVLPGTPIYECNKACKCPSTCPNRVVQEGRTALKDMQYSIYRTNNGCGWGVKTLKSIKKGSFVSLYVGEVITVAESDRRNKEYDAEGCTYLFDLDFNEGDFPYSVDAAKQGNVAHFLNHSCDPNLAAFAVWVNCLDPNLPKIAFFAIKDIPRGTQLTFDYLNRICNPTGTQEGGEEAQQQTRKPCLCGAENCRKFLFI